MECLKWTLSASPIPPVLILNITKSLGAVICSIRGQGKPRKSESDGIQGVLSWLPLAGSPLLLAAAASSIKLG